MNNQDRKAILLALDYIKSKITKLIEGARCEHLYESGGGIYRFKIFLSKNNQCVTEIIFSEENMEDFSNDNTNYGIRFRYYIDFKIYIELIKTGLLPFFKISKIFIQEAADRRKDDWWNDRYVRIAFDNKTTAMLTDGLKKLKELLERTFGENVVDASSLGELKEALDRIKGILDYYNAHKSLDETAASIKSLSILKAAAIYEIAEMERKRDSNRLYLTSKINNEICRIVTFLREGAFLEVRSPDWLGDYVSA